MLGIAFGATGSYFASDLLQHVKNPDQPYADEFGRSISSLSAKDVEQLKTGQGWGLAKPAEFNGYPGPTHIIEFSEQLDLDAGQKTAIESSFSRMRAKAVNLGQALIEAERALDAAFLNKTITNEKLDRLLSEAERARAQLRAVHLAAHLEVTPVLSDAQRVKYASLRGYSNGHRGH
ncbi:MAG: hypothetical protein AAGF55_00920 [Pseudomonadota bacterium]